MHHCYGDCSLHATWSENASIIELNNSTHLRIAVEHEEQASYVSRYTMLFFKPPEYRDIDDGVFILLQIVPPLFGHLQCLRALSIHRQAQHQAAKHLQHAPSSAIVQADFAILVLRALCGARSLKRVWIDDPDSILTLHRQVLWYA